MRNKPADGFDPVSLEILWSRLISIADESAAALLRTSFSTIVRESNDFATALMDANGDSLSENTAGIPSFVGILPRTLKHFLARFPKDTWRPGDLVITNDPWMATGHLPDVTMAAPIFHRGRLVGFSGSIAHLPDIGGNQGRDQFFDHGQRFLCGCHQTVFRIEVDKRFQMISRHRSFRDIAFWHQDFSKIATIEVNTKINFFNYF